ncbi:5-(carboxyamino)imidazole ribonucleotide mutase [Methanohalophilus portucalensis]
MRPGNSKKTIAIFDKFGIDYAITVASAHRTPGRVIEVIEEAHKNNVKVFIAVAGLAAHLPGVVAAHTMKPVIGVPVNAQLDGNDSLLSIVQMPPGIPVAFVGIGRGDNAGILAIQIMAANNKEMEAKLAFYRKELAAKVEKDALSLLE